MALLDSAATAAGAQALADQYNALRHDILTNAGQYVTTTGGTTAYIATLDNQLVVGDMVAGFKVRIKINATNTGPSTLRIDDGGGTLLAATAIKKYVSQDVGPGDLVSGQVYVLLYDGTNFQILNYSQPPTGTMMIWGTASAPNGYVLCDGSSLLRSTYAALFAVIGTTYGAADGTHFNVPNLKGKVPVGYNAAETEFDALGETGGEKTHTMTAGELVGHTHTLGTQRSSTSGGSGAVFQGSDAAGFTVTSNSTGSATPFNVLQPYIALNYIIKT